VKHFVVIFIMCLLLGCSHNSALTRYDEDRDREYSATAITLSDFSMKIISNYQVQNIPVPTNFETQQFFDLLKKIYPDQSKVSSIQSNYSVSVHSLDGGYSVMLCDLKTNHKIMEDLSCHLDRVEILSWKSSIAGPCEFENNWKQYCE
jgi:hypothetical protein